MTDIVQSFRPSPVNQIRFSVAAHAAWAPGRETAAAWQAWADEASGIARNSISNTTTSMADEIELAEPALKAMPPMLRRRASPAGKMALESAYAAYPASGALAEQTDIPAIFCSRHGECGRSAELLIDLARGVPLSPTAFSLSVHNATAGLFSIARHDHANSLALAAGRSTVEHAAIEACSLLADGAPAVLLVVADGALPPMYREFADCDEQAFGWAWLLTAPDSGHADVDAISLRWSSGAQADSAGASGDGDHAGEDENAAQSGAEPGGLQVMRFFLGGAASLQRRADRRLWTWSRDEG